MAAKESVPCACARYKVETPEGLTGTDCTATTKKKFAPGHDAKLRSLLVRAGADSQNVHVTEEDGSVSVMTHIEAAKLHNLVEHVEKGIELLLQRRAKKQETKSADPAAN